MKKWQVEIVLRNRMRVIVKENSNKRSVEMFEKGSEYTKMNRRK